MMVFTTIEDPRKYRLKDEDEESNEVDYKFILQIKIRTLLRRYLCQIQMRLCQIMISTHIMFTNGPKSITFKCL